MAEYERPKIRERKGGVNATYNGVIESDVTRFCHNRMVNFETSNKEITKRRGAGPTPRDTATRREMRK
eukprot:scaffold980_cov248-Pinguiococcus_pyrenoidosus.AAC.13